jgi:hypothetical protein
MASHLRWADGSRITVRWTTTDLTENHTAVIAARTWCLEFGHSFACHASQVSRPSQIEITSTQMINIIVGCGGDKLFTLRQHDTPWVRVVCDV